MTDTMQAPVHRTAEELEAAMSEFRSAPTDVGTLELVVRRPAEDAREILDEGQLDLAEGLVGDTWKLRSSRRTPDGGPHPDMQLNVINARLSRFVALGDDRRAALAGDQLHLDLDLSEDNLPPGTRLHIGAAAVIEVTDQPHTGCQKFTQRFGPAAMRFVNSPEGSALRLRGLNAKVVVAGLIHPGDTVTVERPPG